MRAILICAIFVSMASMGRAQTVEELAEYVSGMPRGLLGTPSYWMEMRSALGWEKMILVVGYANNQPICEMMVRLGSAQSPDREFRCAAAN